MAASVGTKISICLTNLFSSVRGPNKPIMSTAPSHRLIKLRSSHLNSQQLNFLFNSKLRKVSFLVKISLNSPKHIPSSTSSSLQLPLWTAHEIAEAVGGKLVKWGPSGTISSDTRTLQPSQWFFAIKGKNFDAHDFVNHDLVNKGCVGVIGNRIYDDWPNGFVQIEVDSLDSLVKLATFARSRFDGTVVVGLTGSVGKTTTKAMIAMILDDFLKGVFQSPGNWNNEIGVALSLIGIPRNAGVAVLELGMCNKGEILELGRAARPSIRVVLNVGVSHLENFDSLEEIAMAKGEIFKEAVAGDVFVGRRRGCNIRLVEAEIADGGLCVRVVLESSRETVEFVIPTPGIHLAVNACAAAVVVSELGVPLSKLALSLLRFSPVDGHSVLGVARNGIKLINDAYNANPMSTTAAIDLLKSFNCDGKRVAILGDMLELGPLEIEFHEEIIRYCCDSSVDLVGLVGNRFYEAAKKWKENINIIHASKSDFLVPKILEVP